MEVSHYNLKSSMMQFWPHIIQCASTTDPIGSRYGNHRNDKGDYNAPQHNGGHAGVGLSKHYPAQNITVMAQTA